MRYVLLSVSSGRGRAACRPLHRRRAHRIGAPARAFAQFMRKAVAKRPVEQFDTDLRLPEWQLEPDQEDPFGDPIDYYYVDEDGNLIDPRELDDTDPETRRPEGIDRPAPGNDGPPPAVDPEFLDRAINGTRRPPPPTTRPSPSQQTPAPSPTPSARTTSRPVTQPTN